MRDGEEPSASPSDDQTLSCETAIIRASGLFDRREYKRLNPEVIKHTLNPVEHFCSKGWRRLRNPSREFDVWWYWSEYLDPRDETVNPLLHYLLLGRHLGHEPLQPVAAARTPVAYAPGFRPRRACLFAGYDADGLIDDYVLDYVRELSRHADVYYLSDGYVDPAEMGKLAEYTRGAWAISHGAYDFGSYSLLARKLVGWDVLDEYDELVLANDSGYLLRPLDQVFEEMDRRACDWWGLQLTRHDFDKTSNGGRPLSQDEVKRQMVGERVMDELDHLHISSYFLVYRRPVLSDSGFRQRLNQVAPQSEKALVIYKYEIGLSRYLMCRGFDFSTFIPELYAFHPLYTDQYFELLERGFPILKRNFLSENSRDVPDLVRWRDRVRACVPDAPVEMVERNLLRVSPDDRLRRSFSLVSDRAGGAKTRARLSWWGVVDADRMSPTFDHWWAFPVGTQDHVLSGSQRAILEEIRDDPTIKKVILTRGRRVDIPGAERSRGPVDECRGAGSRTALPPHLRPRDAPRQPAVPAVAAEAPIHPRWSRHPPARSAVSSMTDEEREDNGRLAFAVASSKLDALATSVALYPLPPESVWATGALRNDLLLREHFRLPADLRAQEERVRELVGDRRLVFFAPDEPAPGRSVDDPFTDEQVAWLGHWCERNRVVLGFRDHRTDRSRLLSRRLRPIGALHFATREFPYDEVLHRVAVGMVTDHAEDALDFMASGKPVVSYLHASQADEGLMYDLDVILAGAVCSSFEALAERLDSLVSPARMPAGASGGVRRTLLFDELDDQNARRLVRRVKQLYVEG